jgi:formylglycine-generating enzyme required for sulfatase activity
MRISQVEGQAVWRKLLIVCAFGAFSCMQAGAGTAAPAAGNLAARQEGHPITERVTAAAANADPAERRIALVIGNGAYDDDPLANPLNDAQAIGTTLGRLGFEVRRYENASRQQMQEALREFKRRLGHGGVGLFYFAGHGLQVADQTLLLPVDASRRSPARLLTHGIDLRSVLQSMSGPRPGKLNLIILDTCLNNPFNAAAGSGDGGTHSQDEQTLIAYATAPGAFANDGSRHGLYTAALLKALLVPGLRAEQVFRQVATDVRHASGQQQQPWVSSSLSGVFRFMAATPGTREVPGQAAPPKETVAALHSRGILPKDSAEQYELTFWESIKDSTHASDYEAYLQAYPNGRFAPLARSRVERLRAAAPKAETPAKEKETSPAAVPKAAPERKRPTPAVKTAPERPPPAAATPAKSPPKSATAATGIAAVKDCPACPELISLPGGTFTMGNNTSDPSEKPAHQVTLNTPFAIGKYEVTAEQWNACANAGACPHIATNDNAAKNTPARDVSWEDTGQYLKWLSKTSGKHYRLPTEAEWEYAARGGTATRYWWGEQMRSGNANCKECGEPWRQDAPAPVGSFAANPYGLYDMNGSVWEWVSDCWHNTYKGAPTDGRTWDEPNCRVRVIRGGSWREGASYMLSSTRFKYDASVRHSENGFRVARDVP